MGWRPPYEGNEKEYVSSNAPKRIKEIQFQPMKAQQIVRIAEFKAVSHEMYQFTADGKKVPKVDGVLDTRLVSLASSILNQEATLRELSWWLRHHRELRPRPESAQHVIYHLPTVLDIMPTSSFLCQCITSVISVTASRSFRIFARSDTNLTECLEKHAN